MRPITLKLQAFGSYGKETVIDFKKPTQNLFLVTGNTGSGKTTIFDAMVYSLYGEVSSAGNKKDGLELQSQFGNMEETPFVELTFSEVLNGDEKVFIVNRTPRHKRRKKKGSGYTEASGTVSLILPDGSEYPQKEANKKIQEIVGLTKDQFMQVAMIAQGEFMELLRASSDKKKRIFQKLFNTSFYQQIIDELGNRRKALEKDLTNVHSKSQVIAGSITIPEGYGERTTADNLLQNIAEEKKGNIALMEELFPILDKLLVWQNSCHKEIVLEKENLQKVRDMERDRCTDAKNLLTFFQQLKEVQNTLDLLDKKTQEMEEQFVLCQQLKTAYDLQQLWEPYDEAKKTVEEIADTLTQQREKLPKLQQEAIKIRKEKDEVVEKKDAALKEYTRQKEKCNRGVEILAAIETTENEVETKNIAFVTAEKKEKEVHQEIVYLEQKELQWKETRTTLENTPILLEQWNNKWEDYQLAKNSLEEIEQLEEQHQQSKEAVERKNENYEKAKDEYGKQRKVYDEASQRFLDNQAGYIAKAYLKEGEACPVCGSFDHPSPCVITETEILSREEIEELKQQLDTAMDNQKNASEEARDQQQKAAALGENIAEKVKALQRKLEKYLGLLPMESAKDIVSVLDIWKEELTAEEKQKKEEYRKLKEAKISLENLDSQKKELQESLSEATKEREEKKQSLEVAKGKLEQLKTQKTFESKEEAQDALRQAEIKKQEADEQATAINNALTTLEGDISTCKTLLQDGQSKLPKQEEKRDVLLEKYESRLRQPVSIKESFTKNNPIQIILSQTQWKKLVEDYEKDEIEKMEEIIAKYRQDKTMAETKKETTAANIQGKEKPDIEVITKKYNEANNRLVLAEDKEKTLKKEVENNTKAYKKLQEVMKNSVEAMEEHRLVYGMYACLSGNMTGVRMDIETFVQRYYLEHILDAANARFEEMSAGQFQLQMMDMEEAAVGKNKGLDLMVYSTVTGKKRPVGTLSGGESFMAALSLALGMADEITQRSAAINLDVMFIDEGFGSLDDHSRSQAVKVLRQMAGGTRLVGLISHVSELKQEIEDQLLVTKNDEGSHARWQLS